MNTSDFLDMLTRISCRRLALHQTTGNKKGGRYPPLLFGRTGKGLILLLALLAEGLFPAQAYLAHLIYLYDLHQHLIAFVYLIGHLGNAFI